MRKFQCPYCGVGCGLLWEEGRVRGDKEHIATEGDLCQKPLYYPKVLKKDRLLRPIYRENKKDTFREISWEEVYEIIAQRLRAPSSEECYFYLSGQLLTEEIYLINKFVKGFLKTNHIDANSRLCMATPATAYRLAFGSDGPPCTYEDIEDSDAFVFAGSNALWTHPVLFKRVLRRKKKGAKLVVIDPIRTKTAECADLHLQLRAGTDTVLFNAILHILHQKGWIDQKFVKHHVEGYDRALQEASKYTPELASEICQIQIEQIYYLAELYAFSNKLLSFWCQGLNQSSQGVYKNLALINLHLATGRVGKRGCPFSLTGQPNAMGGREMGYLSHGLPGYRDVRNIEDRTLMEDLWGIERGSIKDTPGPTITEAIELMLEGRIKLLWVVCTNPALTLPNLGKVWRALERTFLVVQDVYWTHTCEFANLVLPAAQMGEKQGVMTGSDRILSLCEKFSEPPGEAKPDWLIFKELANKLGYGKAFGYRDTRDIFEELKETTKGRLCDYSALSYESLPARWGRRWLYEDFNFPTESKKAKMHPTPYVHQPARAVLLTGRTKNQWHTMTRTGKSPELLKGEEYPFLLINPEEARDLGIQEGETVLVRSRVEELQLRVKFGYIKKGHVFAPFGYSSVPINLLIVDRLDPHSKEPELKFTQVLLVAAKEALHHEPER